MARMIYRPNRHYKLTRLDENDWANSYFKLSEDSYKTCEDAFKSFSKGSRSNDLKFVPGLAAELQYYIYDGFANGRLWIYDHVVKGSPSHLKLKEISINALAQIDAFLIKLMDDFVPEGANEYTRAKSLKGAYYFRIDNYNRFQYRPVVEHNKIYIGQVMFHHNDADTQSGIVTLRIKKILRQIFTYLEDIELDSDLLAKRCIKLRQTHGK